MTVAVNDPRLVICLSLLYGTTVHHDKTDGCCRGGFLERKEGGSLRRAGSASDGCGGECDWTPALRQVSARLGLGSIVLSDYLSLGNLSGNRCAARASNSFATDGMAVQGRRRCFVYEFGIVVLLGIGTFKVVDMLNEYVDLAKIQSILTIALGALIAWALEFSLFAQWGMEVRSSTLGYIGTGLMIAAAGYATPQVFEHVGEVIGHRRDSGRSVKAA
jgi:hypothetical protein